MEIPISAKIECSDVCHSKCDPENTLSVIGAMGIRNLTEKVEENIPGPVTAELELTCLSGPDDRGRCRAGIRIGIVNSVGKGVLTSYMIRPPK